MSDDAKRERQRTLLEALHPPVADDETARERLVRMLTEDELRALDERVLDAVVAAREPEQDVPFFDAIAAARSAKKRTLIDAVRGRKPAPAPSTLGPSSWDGGVREMSARPETHEQTLIKLLRSREADAGRWL